MKPVSLVLAVVMAAYLGVRWRRFSTEGKGFLLVVIAGLVVHGTGLVALPNFEKLIVDLGTSLGSWTYLLVGAMAFAETGAFLGFVAPGEVTVIVGGVVAGQGQIDVVALIGLVWACCVAGDMTSFYLGRRLGRGFLEHHGRRVQITPERLDKVEDFFKRRGGLTILVGRFIGFVRPLAPFLAGSTNMPFRRFAAFDVLGRRALERDLRAPRLRLLAQLRPGHGDRQAGRVRARWRRSRSGSASCGSSSTGSSSATGSCGRAPAARWPGRRGSRSTG